MSNHTLYLNPEWQSLPIPNLRQERGLAETIAYLIEHKVLIQINPNTLISTKEAASYIGFEEDTIKKHRAQAVSCTPPFHKIGGKAVRYKIADLLAYQAQYRIDLSITEGSNHEK